MKKILISLSIFFILIACASVYGVPTATSLPANTSTSTSTFTPIPPSQTPTLAYTATPIHTLTPTPFPDEIKDSEGVMMNFVPAGDFVMGSRNGQANAQPVSTIYVDAFYMDIFEVSNASYKKCVDAGACQAPKSVEFYDDTHYSFYPVVFVDWNMSKAYCEWRGGRLPTEAEWEKAARGTDERTYPWGEDVNCQYANYMYYHDDPLFYLYCMNTLSSTGYSWTGRSPYGIFDMSGNAAEWVSSLYQPYPYSLTDGREDPNSAGERVVRGGSWSSSATDIYAYHRFAKSPADSNDRLGFRCVKDVTP